MLRFECDELMRDNGELVRDNGELTLEADELRSQMARPPPPHPPANRQSLHIIPTSHFHRPLTPPPPSALRSAPPLVPRPHPTHPPHPTPPQPPPTETQIYYKLRVAQLEFEKGQASTEVVQSASP
jgi:hypothetical protein